MSLTKKQTKIIDDLMNQVNISIKYTSGCGDGAQYYMNYRTDAYNAQCSNFGVPEKMVKHHVVSTIGPCKMKFHNTWGGSSFMDSFCPN